MGKAFAKLVDNIINLKSVDSIYIDSNFPRFVYILAAHMGLKSQLKQNGLKAKETSRRL